MSYRNNKEQEIEMEWEFIEWQHKKEILEGIERFSKWMIMDSIRMKLVDEGINFENEIIDEDGYRIRLESISEHYSC